MPKLFKIAIYTYCTLLFLLGGLSFYITDENNQRKNVGILINNLEDKKEALDNNPSDIELKNEVDKEQAIVDKKLDRIYNRPLFIKIISFLTLSLLSVVMLFCSSFLKATSQIIKQVLELKEKRDNFQKQFIEIEENYESSIARLYNVYNIRGQYLYWITRKSIIEELIALNPSTKEYKEVLLKENIATPPIINTNNNTNSKKPTKS